VGHTQIGHGQDLTPGCGLLTPAESVGSMSFPQHPSPLCNTLIIPTPTSSTAWFWKLWDLELRSQLYQQWPSAGNWPLCPSVSSVSSGDHSTYLTVMLRELCFTYQECSQAQSSLSVQGRLIPRPPADTKIQGQWSPNVKWHSVCIEFTQPSPYIKSFLDYLW
jgi:hypothetical protein